MGRRYMIQKGFPDNPSRRSKKYTDELIDGTLVSVTTRRNPTINLTDAYSYTGELDESGRIKRTLLTGPGLPHIHEVHYRPGTDRIFESTFTGLGDPVNHIMGFLTGPR
jgi:hypothetical protein